MPEPVKPTLKEALAVAFADWGDMEKDSSEFTPPTNEVRNWYADDLGPEDEFECSNCHSIGGGPSYDGMCTDCAGMTE